MMVDLATDKRGKGSNMEANFYTQRNCTIYGHNVWYCLASLPIGNVHIIEYETQGMELQRKYFEDHDKAEKYFQSICKKMLSGKLL